jgi:hypothetical protein
MQQLKNFNPPYRARKALLKYTLTAATLLGAHAVMADSYYCSGNGYNGYINTGDSQAQVVAACGQPTSQTTQAAPQTNNTIQYWTYSNQAVTSSKNLSTGSITTQLNQSGPMIVVEITGDKVSNITVNGQPSQTTNACQTGRPISVGNPSSEVMLSCGNPTSTTTSTAPPPANPPQITVWTYNYGNYQNPMVLQFSSDGTLQSVKQ